MAYRYHEDFLFPLLRMQGREDEVERVKTDRGARIIVVNATALLITMGWVFWTLVLI